MTGFHDSRDPATLQRKPGHSRPVEPGHAPLLAALDMESDLLTIIDLGNAVMAFAEGVDMDTHMGSALCRIGYLVADFGNAAEAKRVALADTLRAGGVQ